MSEQRNRERRLRRLANRQGLRFEKRRDYRIIDQYSGRVEFDSRNFYRENWKNRTDGLTYDEFILDGIERFLTERPLRLTSSNPVSIVAGNLAWWWSPCIAIA